MLSTETLSSFSNLISPIYNYTIFDGRMQLVYPLTFKHQTMEIGRQWTEVHRLPFGEISKNNTALIL